MAATDYTAVRGSLIELQVELSLPWSSRICFNISMLRDARGATLLSHLSRFTHLSRLHQPPQAKHFLKDGMKLASGAARQNKSCPGVGRLDSVPWTQRQAWQTTWWGRKDNQGSEFQEICTLQMACGYHLCMNLGRRCWHLHCGVALHWHDVFAVVWQWHDVYARHRAMHCAYAWRQLFAWSDARSR
jgi:hypothetical protein